MKKGKSVMANIAIASKHGCDEYQYHPNPLHGRRPGREFGASWNAHGDGIYIRKDRPGYWISYRDSDGRRRRRKVEAPNRTKAADLRSGYVSREETAKAHGVRPAGPETFASVADQYLAHQKVRTGAANYRREHGIVHDHLMPFFAGELRAIRKATVQRYVTCTFG